MSAAGRAPGGSPGPGEPRAPVGAAELDVLVVVEQLRRAVPGGIGTYTRGLIRGLRDLAPGAAPHVTLIASRAARGRPDPLGALGPTLRTIPLGPRSLVKAWDLGLARVGRDASLVHATSTLTPPTSVPLVATVHDLAWRHLPWAFPPRGRRWHEASLRRTLRRAAAIVVPSEQVAAEVRDLVETPGGGGGRVVVVEEGADHLPSPDPEGTRRALDALGVAGEYLLAVGTLEPRKNLARLVEAYESVRPGLPEPWPLVVVGPAGWGRAGDGGEARPGVVFAGAVRDSVLSGLYAGARCVAYVPLLEGYGLPVVEAMRAGTPVVASAVPSARGAALEVDPLDVDSIASGLSIAATDGGRRDRLVDAGRRRTEGLTWRRCAEHHVSLWCDVAGAPR